MQSWTFDSPDPEQTREMGAALGRCIGREGLILALIGPLGAGKTVFVKGLAEGLGVDPRLVSSPTFVIAQEYPLPAEEGGAGPTTLHHIDLYRLESEDELEAIGFFDMLAPGNVLAVEWADRFAGVLGRKVLTIELEGPSASESSTHVDAAQGDPERAEEPPESGSESGSEVGPGPVRTARLTASGEAAERVLADFAARAEATPTGAVASAGQGAGQSLGPGRRAAPEMRFLSMLGLSLAGLAFLGLGSARFQPYAAAIGGDLLGPGPGCGALRELVELERDALGTLRAICVEREPTRREEQTLSGVGRLVSGERIDLDRVNSALLQALPGIGPARAESILALRTQGALRNVRDLERVPGIGPKTRARLDRWIRMPSDKRSEAGSGTHSRATEIQGG